MTPSEEVFKDLQWLPFPNRLQYHTCLLAYKALNGLAPEYLSNLFTKTSEVHSRSLRSGYNYELRVPFARINYFTKSFSVKGVNRWNALSVDIQQTSNINSFKTALKIK